MLRIVDANQYVRRHIETDIGGYSFRTLYQEVQASPDLYIYVWDGPKSLDRRRAIYPGYKIKKDNEQPSADVFASFEFMQLVLSHSKALQIIVPGYEADDVIATLVNQYKVDGVNDIHIHSTDQDLLVLGVPTDRESLKVEQRWIRLYKTLVGDPSDKIPGVKGFGQKAWEGFDDSARSFVESWLLGNIVDIIHDLPWPKTCRTWLQDEVNQKLIRSFYSIIGFFDVDEALIDQHTTVGVDNPQEAEALLSYFMN